MTKINPILTDDAYIYRGSHLDAIFSLNARFLFDKNFGQRFDEQVIRRLNLKVGLLVHTADVADWDDHVLESFFQCLNDCQVNRLHAIPTGYHYASDKEVSVELNDFSPSLIGIIEPNIFDFSKIRGGQIGIYSGSHMLFSPCLNYAFLDVNGAYSMILGPEKFVEKVLGIAWNDSWISIQEGAAMERIFLDALLEAKSKYLPSPL